MRKGLPIQIAFFVLTIISLLNISCSGSKEKIDKKNLIPEKDLISLLTDIHIATGLLAIPSIDEIFLATDSITTYYQVIEKHGYTKENFDKTIRYYFLHDPKRLNSIYDNVLVILSDMEVQATKDYLAEQARLANLWRTTDFIYEPSNKSNDSLMFDIELSKPGIYILIYTCTVYPDDQSVNSRSSVYSVPADSLKTKKLKYVKSAYYLKDGRPHTYNLKISVTHEAIHFLRGWFFDSVFSPEVENHFRIENINLTYSPSNL